MLILTNLSWVRNPYGDPIRPRPNPNPLWSAIFNFMGIQVGRLLNDIEVREVNFVIKSRAYRYIAAGKEEWLYPEGEISPEHWDKLGNGYLFMPDPRSVSFSTEVVIGYEKGADAFDSYGRKPWQGGYRNKPEEEKEWDTFHAFQGQFARVFGPRRRGRSFEGMRLDNEEDSPDFHKYHLSLESRHKAKMKRH